MLDEKEVNIDSLRENVRSYQELEKTLNGVRSRIAQLAVIEEQYKAVCDCFNADAMYDYFLAQSDVDMNLEKIKKLEQEIVKAQFALEELNKDRSDLQAQRQSKNEIYTTLLIELKQNKEYQALEMEIKHLDELKAREEEQFAETKQVLALGSEALPSIHKLGQLPNAAECFAAYEKVLRNLQGLEAIGDTQALMQKIITDKKSLALKMQQEKLETQRTSNELKTELMALDDKIQKLERRSFSYPTEVEFLKEKIVQKFLEIGRNPEIHVLCELLDLKDEKWRKAVEGYLNTQRFYLLVEPEYFDVALSVYDALRREKKVAGVGLINTGKLEAFSIAPQGTLATMVTSGNVYAQRYINMILGKVQMCYRSEELKQYVVAITPDGMRYQNHVASLLRAKTYDPPYIGSNALKIQLTQYRQQRNKILDDKNTQDKKGKQASELLQYMDFEKDISLSNKLPVLRQLRQTKLAIAQCVETIDYLRKMTDDIEKQFQIEELKNELEALNRKISQKDKEDGALQTRKLVAETDLIDAKRTDEKLSAAIVEIIAKADKDIERWQLAYQKQTLNRSYENFRSAFDRRKKANLTVMETARDKMTAAMVAYKTAFDFGAPATFDAYQEYSMVYDRLVHSELLTYEDKVTKARISAEEEFREQFLSKLQENMKQAQSEFKELNKALKGIVFSNERYEFVYLVSKKYSKYYEMIMDDFNVAQGESIFVGTFHENHKEVIDELFSRLAFDQDNAVKTLEEYTDYRTYMDYDIRIIHEDGNYSMYSKVCEEKSGGETQTPFYVTVAASFVQLYSNNIGGEALGLVMFDEAFNNMDDERIGGVLEFLNRLPLQLIIAAPPDKVQYIGPKMVTTLLVLTDHKQSYVEEFRDVALRKENFKQSS